MANKSIQEEINKALTDYVKDVGDVVAKDMKEVGEATVEKVAELSPKDKGDYSKGWSLKKPSKKSQGILIAGVGVTIYNKDHYRLTHLLEKSHLKKNQFGEYGRSTPQPHIAEAEEWGANLLLERITRDL